MKSLFLCYVSDGPYWDNTLLVPGYPSGFSYFRPFRYRDKWVQPSLLEEMGAGQLRTYLKGAEATLCMRFLTNHTWKILPIRKVLIRHVDYLPDNHSIHFSTGPLFDFTSVNTLTEATISIESTEQDYIGNSLFFRADLPTHLKECDNDTMEDAAWSSFSDLITSETTLPIREEARSAVFVRFRKMNREKPAQVGSIHESWSSGEVHGMILHEGESYELVFFHRVPVLISRAESINRSIINFKSSSGNLELNSEEEHLTGNYQTHILNVTALKPSGTWEEIIIQLPEQIQSQTGQTVNTANTHIPLKISVSLLHRLKRTYIWLIMIWLSLVVNIVITHRLEGKTDYLLIGASAAVAFFAAVGVYMLQQKSTSK